ncbi:MAG: monofunctional biosynthetic peptidoglycan transglycosylase [Gammaproteobacteria bacterium]|nr:monofunctional biosynthetic peptidoglycan transglycosylase [Gammaproteobacteria bacterium]
MNYIRLRRWIIRVLAAVLLISIVPVLVLRWVAPPTSSVILQRGFLEGRPQDYQWVSINRISPYAALAVVAAEDQKFPQHHGFDIAAIKDAVHSNASGGRLRGASTLTQQVARNLFLWQGRSYLRKGLEAWFTLLLELFWSKERILEVYLNIAETGKQTFGVEAAAWRFFQRPAIALSREQAALIAAVLPSPGRSRLDRPSDYILQRQANILQQMKQLGGTAWLKDILPEVK